MPHIPESLRDIQRTIAKEVVLQDQLPIESIKRIGAFDCSQVGDKLICAAIVLDYPSMNVVERQYLIKRAPMPYVPGYLAFREGPLMLELYYKLENDPDVLMVDGHGVAHPVGCGLACYVGVELHKPTIGVAKSLLLGQVDGERIILDGIEVGKIVQTRQHAKPVFVTPGHLITIETAAQLTAKCVIPPHKLPEPIHIAHRMADKVRDRMLEESQGALKTDAPEVD
ncbi:endonuclease V [Candidatus Woesearchaeota archaeon]|nr:endonuclease V [Candidatus Woesearchaeota archaeon]